jgi:hypothetical protein
VTGRRPLTARGLKAMLTRAGVDHSELEIRDDYAVWTNVETGQHSTSVVISGPKDLRWQAASVLYDKGLANAPYPECDMWSRPGGVLPRPAEPAELEDVNAGRLIRRAAGTPLHD